MKNTILLIIAFLLLQFSAAAGGKKFGKPLSLKETTKISTILDNPKNFVGKKVLVEGTIIGVCSKRGCWIELSSDKPFQKMKVKVNDGEIVFPMEAKGKKALVEGEIYEIKFTKEEAIERAKDMAEEAGKPFDPKSVKGPLSIYQLRGLGAEIK